MSSAFSVDESEEEDIEERLRCEEKLHLLEIRLETLEALIHNKNKSCVADPSVKYKGNVEDEDEGNIPISSPTRTTRTCTVTLSDIENKIPHQISCPGTPSTIDDDELPANPRSLFWHTFPQPGHISRQRVINEEVHDEDYFKELNEDTFTLMILSEPLTKQWLFGLVVFMLQITLLVMILVTQYGESKESTPLDMPYKVDPSVQVGQLLAMIVALATQTDLVIAIITFMMLWIERRAFWTSLIKVPEDSSLWIWLKRIAFPLACEFIEGLLVLQTTFLIVVTSDSVIDLFKDFAALQVISQLDDMMFWLALQGYIGKDLALGAKRARKIKIHDTEIKTLCGIPFRTIILIFIFCIMGGGWGYFVHGQVTGDFFNLKYPHCKISSDSDVSYMDMGNKICDGALNTIECGYDDGDCITFNLGYPNCRVKEPEKIGNGECDMEYNTQKCNFDGGDCCPKDVLDSKYVGDGICNGGIFNTETCNFDGGDCDRYNKKYPNCEILRNRTDYHNDFDFKESEPPGLGDGKCNGGVFNNKECGYDGGDCIECNGRVPDPSKIGDGYCDGGVYLDFDGCNLDGGDCTNFVASFPHCFVPYPGKVGDGVCDGGSYFTSNCDYDGWDCKECHVPNPLRIGDGWCDGGTYMSKECGNDGGDCSNCQADPSSIGNGKCDLSYNTTECSWDGGDCLNGGRPIVCEVLIPAKLGNEVCDGGEYNTKECEFDRGDCAYFNHEYPDCEVEKPWQLADHFCDGGEYNTEECGFDAGDCAYLNEEYPDCNVTYPSLLGDGTCDGGEYNTAQCGFDAGDCDFFNNEYPNCDVEFPSLLGDGICDGGQYNTEECGYDELDCTSSNETAGENR